MSMQKPLIILGAGGFALELFSWASHCQRNVVAFFDEKLAHPGLQWFGVPVVSALEKYKHAEFLLGVGDPMLKERFWDLAVSFNLTPALPLVHASSVIGHGVNIALGAIICPNAILTTNILVEEGALINIAATVGHDCKIGRMATISPGANISGKCQIAERAYIGTNAAIREKLNIGRGSIVGMGAVVVKDVPAQETHVGTPARKMLSSV